jgi:hypothetical protein
VASRAGQSFFGDQLPMEMRSYRGIGGDVQVSQGKLMSGHLWGRGDRQARGQAPPATRFDVPADKRLLQLSGSVLTARSGLGRALSAAIRTVQNYYVEGANGQRYLVAGKYAVANVRGRQMIEIHYLGGREDAVGRLGAFSKVKEEDLKADDQFYLLFLVDPGVQITGFSTGGPSTQREDLTSQNLVAPN